VYLTHDEFKGRTPIVRPGGLEIHAAPERFANPSAALLMETTSSGSSGAPTRTPKGLERTRYGDAIHALLAREHDLDGRAHVELKTILPGATGLYAVLRRARERRRLAWFCAGGSWRRDGHYRLATHAAVLLARSRGCPAPFPVFLAKGDFTPAARWLAERRREGLACSASGMTSAVTRVAAAALDHGLDISGATFQCGGEALTDTKRALMARAGVTPVIGYHISELGAIGHACRRMADGNRVHHYSESTAIVSHRRRVPLADVEVDSLLFTTLLPFAPLVLINVEMDDAARVGPSRCECTLARAGWTTEIRDIFSFGKLTGQGMTLVGSDILHVLESALPARFGGHPGDFQLVEREGAHQTEMDLLVSPRLGAAPHDVHAAFLAEVRKRQYGLQAERIWTQSQALRVVMAEPVPTRTGTVHPLRLLGAARESARAS
jgi:hypothetical protein